MMQTQRAAVQIQNYLYEPNVDTLPTSSQSVLKCRIKTDSGVRKTLAREGILRWIICDFILYELHGQRFLMSLVLQRDKGLHMKDQILTSKLERIYFRRLNEVDSLPASLFLLHKTELAWHWQRPHLTFDLVLWPCLRFFVPADQYVICQWPHWVPNQDEKGIYGFSF